MLKIGIDLDNTINENDITKSFFFLMTQHMWKSGEVEIHIITNREQTRNSRRETLHELEHYGIHYDFLEITPNKHDYILKHGINVYFDDTDEYFQSLPESVTVFKIREGGNFDFDDGKWVYGNKTGRNIDRE
jgi:hypothetical protein